jgi:uncharacterized membrane protein
MVVNHTARWWIDRPMGWFRYQVIYVTLTLAAPIFLFLVGFCIPLAHARHPERPVAAHWTRRAFVLLLTGYLLNALVFPEDPIWSGGVLQTIGTGILVTVAALALARGPAGPAALFLLAALLYLTFAWSFPTLAAWLPAHPVVADVFFFDFPPWPWIGMVLVGVALGLVWLDVPAPRRGRSMAALGAGGVACLALFAVLEMAFGPVPHLSFKRDFLLNQHWTPRGLTLLWIAGSVLALLAASYWLIEARRYAPAWLMILGQTAFVLYVVHQVIAYTIVKRLLGVSFTSWSRYGAATAALMIGLVYLGYGWAALRRRFRRATPRPPDDQPTGATSTIASNSA